MAARRAEPPSLADALGACRVVVCVGAGGVGKTTTAAAIGAHAARLGRRAVVITIDPARRLADALGLDAVGNTPVVVEGPWTGTLHALMLDAKGTFDTLVERYARDGEQRARILANPIYQNIAGALSGTHDYMAVEKLYELVEAGGYDLIVVDTPPTHHALAFLDAPRLLVRLLDNRIYRLLMAPRGLVRAVNSAAQVFVRQLTKVVGGSVVDDAIAFFRAFEGMEEGFTERARAVNELLRRPDTAFTLVVTPRSDAIEAAAGFVEQLAAGGVTVRACVVNRVTPSLPAVARNADVDPLPERTALDELRKTARAERRLIGELAELIPAATVVPVPMLDRDVHDLAGIEVLEASLFPGLG